MRLSWPIWTGAAVVGLAAVGAFLRRTGPVATLTIADPRAHWASGAFAEMVPPIRLPTSFDGEDHITVWVRIPDGSPVRAERDGDRWTLVYPPGTVADRVEMREPVDIDGEHAWRVSDVRGTRLGDNGTEYFHVLRAVARDNPRLAGFEWTRDDPAGAHMAIDRLEDLLRKGLLRDVDESKRTPMLARLRRLNDCASCHEHDRGERSSRSEGGPHRSTDRAGFYAMLSVLGDAAPLETHRPRDTNVDDPFVEVSCGADTASLVNTRGGARYTCPGDRVPVARLNVAKAIEAGQPHAAAVCRSRRYLYDHMDVAARAAFAPSFTACGIRE
jgi:hypothetical protein